MLPIIPPLGDPAIRRRERELAQEADNARLIRTASHARHAVPAPMKPAIAKMVCLLVPAAILAALLLWEGIRLMILLLGALGPFVP